MPSLTYRVRCKYGHVLDSAGCPTCECTDPCKNVRCKPGYRCEAQIVPCDKPLCIKTDCVPVREEWQCPFVPFNGRINVDPTCPPPCKEDADCPITQKCCEAPRPCVNTCQNSVYPVKKPGKCLKFVSPYPPTPCARPIDECRHDGDCPGSQKCCPRNRCGGLVCGPPVPVPKPRKCPKLVIPFPRPLCPIPIPKCKDDADCPGNEKCCRRHICGGFECGPPAPEMDVCKLPPRRGPCRRRALVWYFDKRPNVCRRFVYGGCGGNGNRFDTRQLCEAKCKPSSCSPVMCDLYCKYGFQLGEDGCPICKCIQPCEGVKCKPGEKCVVRRRPCLKKPCPPPGGVCVKVNKRVCRLPARRGPCFPPLMRWYYNNRRNVCQTFRKGCGRNGNRFATKEDCEAVCKPSPSHCPPFECKRKCKYGFSVDAYGCPECICLSRECVLALDAFQKQPVNQFQCVLWTGSREIEALQRHS
ncbi:Papilin [Lamellibrachia satsuma]|nr:Papilin [Lamellibrachia satsuma]